MTTTLSVVRVAFPAGAGFSLGVLSALGFGDPTRDVDRPVDIDAAGRFQSSVYR
jgi:hypothetical protein